LDNSYAQNFLTNFNNCRIVEVQDYLKEIPLLGVFHDTKEDRSHVVPKAETREERLKNFTKLKMIWDAGDFCFAPDL
jgi:hypothetical protein